MAFSDIAVLRISIDVTHGWRMYKAENGFAEPAV
jgi:hypothetical protein